MECILKAFLFFVASGLTFAVGVFWGGGKRLFGGKKEEPAKPATRSRSKAAKEKAEAAARETAIQKGIPPCFFKALDFLKSVRDGFIKDIKTENWFRATGTAVCVIIVLGFSIRLLLTPIPYAAAIIALVLWRLTEGERQKKAQQKATEDKK